MTDKPTHDDFPPDSKLSPLQQRAVILLAIGQSYRRVSAELGVSVSTVHAWKQLPEFAEQIDALSADITRRFQAVNLRAMGRAIRTLHRIAFDENAKTSDRLAAISRILDMANNWYIVQPLESARRRMESMANRE